MSMSNVILVYASLPMIGNPSDDLGGLD